jgi:hypothetical protein
MALTPEVLAALGAIERDWALLPIDNRKRPVDAGSGALLRNWVQRGMDREQLIALAGSPHVHAVGVVLGPASRGLLAIDFDGAGSGPTFRRVYGRSHRDLPLTVGWTSGLPQRCQLAFRVAPELWPRLRGRRIWRWGGRTVLELRWQGHQSVIAGVHPDTAGYRWLDGRSPQQAPLALAPDWLLEPLLREPSPPTACSPAAEDEVTKALALLRRIHPREDYQGWLEVGMALHAVDPGLLEAWVGWSQGCVNFDEAECRAKWVSFNGSGLTIGTLHHYAALDGSSAGRAAAFAAPVDPAAAAKGQAQDLAAADGPVPDGTRPAGTADRVEPPRDQQIAALLDQLLDRMLETRDTWAQEQAIRAELWSLGVPTAAIDERILYALAQRWQLPIQPGHERPRRSRRLSDPISSPAEDLLPGFLLWRRDHVLFGAGGSGKTMAAAAMAVCCIKGLPFLDQEIPPSRTGRVLWIGSDGGESARAMAREYLEDLGVADDPAVEAGLTFWTAEPEDAMPSWACTPAGINELRLELAGGGYVLVVIDSLKAVLELAGINFGIGPVGTLMRLLQAVVGRHCSLLWLHHPSGSKAAKGLQAAAGNQNINQIPAGVHQISRRLEDRGPCNLWSVHKLRGSTSREFAYRLSDEGFVVSEGQITGNARTAVLDALARRRLADLPTSSHHLCAALSGFNEGTVRNNLTWLRKRGLVRKHGSAWLLTRQGQALLEGLKRGDDGDYGIQAATGSRPCSTSRPPSVCPTQNE